MSIEPDREQFFQYATFGVAGLTIVVCLCYGLIFANPNLNFISSLRPVVPTATVAALAFPATWTPTLTRTPTKTPTAMPTDLPTDTPTITPIPSKTRPGIPTFTPIPPLPPATSRPPGPAPTIRPPTAIPRWAYAAKVQKCNHSGGTYVEGTVFLNWAGQGVQNGLRIRVSNSPGGAAIAPDSITGSLAGRAGYYTIALNSDGAKPGTWYVWVVGANGSPASDPQAGRFTTNNWGPNTAGSCWQQYVDFVKQ